MSSANCGVRFVKCPSCLRILPEHPDIPVYKCGGCGTVLRAKFRIANVEKAIRTSLSEKQVSAQSSVLDDRREKQLVLENMSCDDDRNAGKKWFDREESFENSKDEIDEGIPELESLSSVDQLGLEGMSINTWSAGQVSSIETKGENLLNDMAEMTLKLYQQGHESMKISESMEDSEDSTDCDCDASPERDLVRKAFDKGDSSIVGDVSETSQTSSTSDDSCNSCDPEHKTDLPESTFRPENQPDTAEKDAEDHLAEDAVNCTSDAHRRIDQFNEKASDEKDGSNVAGKFDLNSDEQQPSKYKAHAERESSSDSGDFHSALNWMEQENDDQLSSLSKDSVGDESLSNHQRHDNSASKEEAHHGVLQTKILRKVDIFRNELSELFDKSGEKEVRAKPSFAKHKSLHPRGAYHQRSIEKPPCSSFSRCETQISCRNGQCWRRSSSCKAGAHGSKLKTMRTMEKRQKPQQLFRPVLGGAPFVICYNCFKLLQLPTDFHVSRKRLHKLRCGSCSEILLYSYRPKTHSANPQTLAEADSDKQIESVHERRDSHPTTFTEEYGFSFGKSHSTQPDPPLYVSRNTSFNSRDERSSKGANGLRLHWLMGYSSASELLRQRSSGEYSGNTEPKRVNVARPSEEKCATAATSDGYSWRKYGQKQVKSSENSRSYYRCTDTSCSAKKKVEHRPDGRIVEIICKGEHNHEPPQKPKCPKERGSQSCGPLRENELSENTNESDPSTRKTEKNSTGETPQRNLYCSSDCEGNAGIKIEEDPWKEPDPKRRMIESTTPCRAPVLKTIREPKIIVQTASDAASLIDGYRWRKYGQKIVKGNPNPRSYYRCTHDGCPVRKHVERASDNAENIVITYEGKHNHDSPSLKNGNDSRASPRHLATKVAVKGEQNNTSTVSSDQNPMEESKPVLDGKSVGDKALELGGEKALESAQTLLSIGFSSSSGDHVERSTSGGVKHPLFNEKPAAVRVQNS